MATDNGEVGARIRILTTDATKQIGALDKATKKYGKTLKEAFNTSALLGFVALISDLTKTMINASKKQIDYIENINLLNNAYGESIDKANQLITKFENIGFDSAKITKSLANYRQLADALGLASDKADTLSSNLLQMQYDIGSLYNLSDEEAQSKMISAITGEARAVKELGADLTQAGLQQTAYNLGITKSVKNMTQAEKTILRQITLQRQLSNSQGDLKRTAESTANQVRILKDQIATLGRLIGGTFIKILDGILPILNGVLMTINTIIKVIQEALGFDAEKLAGNFKKSTQSVIDYGNSIEEASQKADKSLRGFDKLNTISTPTNTSVGGGVDKRLLDGLIDYQSQLDKIETKAMKIKGSILKFLGFEQDDQGKWKFGHITLGTIVGVLGALLLGYLALKPVINIFDKLFGKKKTKDVKDNGTALSTVGDGFSSMLKSLGKATFIIALLGGLSLVIKEVTKLIETFSESGLELSDVAWLLGITLTEVVIAVTALAGVSKLFSITGIIGMAVALGGLVLILKELNQFFKMITDSGLSLGEVAGFLGIVLGEVVLAIALLSTTAYLLSTNPLALLGLIAIVGSFILILKALNDYLPIILNSILNFAGKIGKAINNSVTEIIDAITKLINFLISGIEYMINTLVISSLNSFIKKINKLIPGESFDIGKISNVSITRFKPKLYKDGGFPDEGQLFIAREKGAEMVGSIGGKTAVANNDQIVQAISVGVAKAMMVTGNKDVNVTIEAQGDTSGLLDFINFKQKEKNRQYGF